MHNRAIFHQNTFDDHRGASKCFVIILASGQIILGAMNFLHCQTYANVQEMLKLHLNPVLYALTLFGISLLRVLSKLLLTNPIFPIWPSMVLEAFSRIMMAGLGLILPSNFWQTQLSKRKFWLFAKAF